jgi:hypothetical protein
MRLFLAEGARQEQPGRGNKVEPVRRGCLADTAGKGKLGGDNHSRELRRDINAGETSKRR